MLGRLEDCSFDARSTLKTAAIIGKFFTLTELQALLPDKSPSALLVELDELVSAQIVVEHIDDDDDDDVSGSETDDEVSIGRRFSTVTDATYVTSNSSSSSQSHVDDDEIVYSFIHSSMFETVYSLLLSGHRRRLHGKFARYLESVEADAMLAVFHFERSDNPIEAIEPYLRWGTRLGQLSELGRSIAVFERATKLVDKMMADKKAKKEKAVKSPEACKYATVYLKLLVKMLQQKVAHAATTGSSQDSVAELHQSLTTFVDTYNTFVPAEEVLRVLSVSMWVTLFGGNFSFDIFSDSIRRLVQQSLLVEDPQHRLRAWQWDLLCARLAEDMPKVATIFRNIESTFFAQEDPSAGSQRLALNYGLNYDIQALMMYHQEMVMRGDLHTAQDLWRRLKPHYDGIQAGK